MISVIDVDQPHDVPITIALRSVYGHIRIGTGESSANVEVVGNVTSLLQLTGKLEDANRLLSSLALCLMMTGMLRYHKCYRL